MKSALLLVCLFALSSHMKGGDLVSPDSYEAWQRRHPVKDPSLTRWYPFTESVDAGELPGADSSGNMVAALRFELRENPEGGLQIVEGRWPQKKGVRLDQGTLVATPCPADKPFTVAAWIRLNGMGTHRGNDGATNGTLLSAGSGYWDGWRLTVSYPLRKLSFEIGRPKPSHSIGIQADASLAEGVWHHVAATWDGSGMRLFVDGRLAGSGPYDGDYTPPFQGAQFRIGYANHGVGSVAFDVDEVAIHSRALSAPDILEEVKFCGPQAPDVRSNLAKSCLERNDLPGARQHLGALLDSPVLGRRDRRDALFDLADVCRQMRDFPAARAAYVRIVEAEDSSPEERVLARLGMAASYARQDHKADAKEEFSKAGAVPGAPPHLKQEAVEGGDAMDRLLRGLPARGAASTRTASPKLPSTGDTLFVAPNGADTHSGTKDRPFATLERARDEIRALRNRKPESQTRKPVTVFIRGGDYPVAQTFKLGSGDSGTAQAPVVYSAFGTEIPRFTGGVRVRKFTTVTDPAVLARFAQEARGKVWQADLKAQDVRDYGTFAPVGAYGSRSRQPQPEVFFDGDPMEIARWPNEGFVKTGGVFGPEETDERGEKRSIGGEFEYDGDRPSRWKAESDAWLYGYWYHDWADSYEKIASIDADRRRITLAPPLHKFGFAAGRRYYALNMLSEIDRSGEWYLDRDRGLLYLWPPSDPNAATVEVSMFAGPLVKLDGVAHVTFRGLVWETGRDDGVHIRGGERCLLAGCTVRNFAGDGVVVDGGTAHGVLSCEIFSMGRGGVIMRGGDRQSLAPGNHFVENCHIQRVSRINHTYAPAVLAEGVGIRIAHNLMHDMGSSAMRVEGNDHLVEFNEVHDVVRESDDQGGVDVWGNPTFRGNVYRYNFFHHIGNGRSCGQAGIRLDDAISGTLIYRNIFWRCADGNFGGVQIHGGKDNIVDSNLFLDCRQAVSFNSWGRKRWERFLDTGTEALKQVDITQPPYSIRYPELAALRENPDANHIWRNLVVQCGRLAAGDTGVNDFIDNHVVGGGSGELVNGTFRWNPPGSSPAWQPPIPFDEIGLYRDPLRTSLPERNQERQ